MLPSPPGMEGGAVQSEGMPPGEMPMGQTSSEGLMPPGMGGDMPNKAAFEGNVRQMLLSTMGEEQIVQIVSAAHNDVNKITGILLEKLEQISGETGFDPSENMGLVEAIVTQMLAIAQESTNSTLTEINPGMGEPPEFMKEGGGEEISGQPMGEPGMPEQGGEMPLQPMIGG